ncbi:ion transporter [Pseudomonadota bacterium]
MSNIKATLFSLLEETSRTTRQQRLFDRFLVALILGNVLAVILESVNSLQLQYGSAFRWFEYVSVCLFSVELLLRYWVTEKQFWHRSCTYTDILAVLPFYLGFFINIDLRLLRLFRLIRVFRISPYFRSLSLLAVVLKQEYRPMLSALSVILILMLLAAGGIYLLEREGQPEVFGDIPSALWWVVVTLTTVGYGDAIPATVLGKLLGAVIMLLGVGMVALPAGMLASRFSEVMHQQQTLFRRFVKESVELSGNVDEVLVEQKRLELFISRGEAKTVVAHCIEHHRNRFNFCPHCGKGIS